MKLKKLGKNTSQNNVEVTHISTKGIWLLVNGKEFFLPFREYPWFVKATIEQIHDVKLLHGIHLHWKKLDVDLEVGSLENPENYPLRFIIGKLKKVDDFLPHPRHLIRSVAAKKK